MSSEVMDDAAKAIDERFTINREYHVPYLAGYSQDGHTIYIDSRMPEGFEYRKGAKKHYVGTDQFLIVHEAVEKALLAFFKAIHRPIIYEFAHQIALRAEKSAVESEGCDWDEYQEFMAYWVKSIGKEGYTNLPPDLDLEPYQDEDDPHVAALRKRS